MCRVISHTSIEWSKQGRVTWSQHLICNMQSLIILLLLVRPVCLGMCLSVPVHIHPHMCKTRLVIENWQGINEPCLYWVSCILRTTASWASGTELKPIAKEKGSYLYALNRNGIRSSGANIPHQNTWWPSSRIEVSVAQHLTIINKYTYWFHQFSHPSVSCSIITNLYLWWSVYGD